jgi:starvation-inducible DNA-binding protein
LKSLIKLMNKTRNTLPPHIRKEAIGVLNNIVADLFDLFARIKQAHWNVRGTAFIGLHKLLDEFGGKVMSHIDLAAERATALGGIVEGTLRESVKHSQLKKKEEPSSISGMSDWIHELADVHAAAGERVRMAIKKMTAAEDFGTADLLTDVLRILDLQLWLLEAHINRHQHAT